MEEQEVINLVMLEQERSEEERLAIIGQTARPEGLGLGNDGSDETNVELGRSIMGRIKEQVGKTVCTNDQVKKLASRQEESSPTIVLIIVDIAATFLSGPAVFTATASVLAFGIKRICAESWTGQDDS
jgi:hypothetical protein